MKKIKAFSLVFVVLALLVSLSACGKDDNKALVGTWKADLDATQIIDEQLSSLGMEDLALESRCVITLVLEFDASSITPSAQMPRRPWLRFRPIWRS